MTSTRFVSLYMRHQLLVIGTILNSFLTNARNWYGLVSLKTMKQLFTLRYRPNTPNKEKNL